MLDTFGEDDLLSVRPEQVERLIAEAYSDQDEAIHTVGLDGGGREAQRHPCPEGLRRRFTVEVVRLEDGYTTYGGFAGNKGRRTRSVPMSANVRRVLWPLCEGKDGDELVFQSPSRPGEPICGSELYRRFVSACKRAGLPG